MAKKLIMRLNIRCDGESAKFYKTFWELNMAKNEIATVRKTKIFLELNKALVPTKSKKFSRFPLTSNLV